MSRILIVEDEAHLADGLRFNLEAEGHEVDVDGDGQQALDRLLGDRIALRRRRPRRDAARQGRLLRRQAAAHAKDTTCRC